MQAPSALLKFVAKAFLNAGGGGVSDIWRRSYSSQACYPRKNPGLPYPSERLPPG
jgi:hypothetical protein